jgi:hypothetical protein
MKYTNKKGLPKTLASALEAIDQGHDRQADFSASDFTIPIRVKILRERYSDQIEVDVFDTIWKAFGSSIHAIMERGDVEDAFKETRFFGEIEVDGVTYTISGKPDLYEFRDNGIITDYKVTSVWKYVIGLKEEREKTLREWNIQGNIYAWLLSEFKKFPVNTIQVLMFFRDWKQSEAIKNGLSYPKPVEIVRLDIANNASIKMFVRDKVDRILRCRELSDDDLPICTESERWQKPVKFKVFGYWRKKALDGAANFSTREAAEEWIDRNYPDGNHRRSKVWIEEFPSTPTRCEGYCDVNQWCSFYREYQKRKGGEE